MAPHEVNQLARDIAAIINQYVGPAGEIVVDTDSWTIRLQDNSTVGGHIFAPLDITDLRYQASSAFLTSILGLEGLPGFLYVGSTSVGTRALTFSGQFTQDNGVLPTDPLTVSLKTIQTGAWEFGTVTADTFYGDLIGNTVGTHVGGVVGNVTGNSAGTHTGPSIGAHTGGVDVRGASLLLDNEQIPNAALTAAMQALLSSSARIPPQWSIMLWDTARAIPAGWQECDGTNGTVDLRGFFPVGASAADVAFNAGVSGGSKSHTHGAIVSAAGGGHTHNLIVTPTSLSVANLPPHDHPSGIKDDNVGSLAVYGTVAHGGAAGGIQHNASGTVQPVTGQTGSGTAHGHGGTTDAVAAHTHSTTIPSLEALPPYKVVRFIQRVAA